jgi:hypothetical protein
MGEHGDFQRIFSHLETVEASPSFCAKVVAVVYLARLRQARRRFRAWCVLAFAGGASFVVSSVYAAREIAVSNFPSYVSLLFSDAGSLALVWKEFLFSLVESLPLLGLTLAAAAVFALLISIRLGIRYTKVPMRFA